MSSPDQRVSARTSGPDTLSYNIITTQLALDSTRSAPTGGERSSESGLPSAGYAASVAASSSVSAEQGDACDDAAAQTQTTGPSTAAGPPPPL